MFVIINYSPHPQSALTTGTWCYHNPLTIFILPVFTLLFFVKRNANHGYEYICIYYGRIRDQYISFLFCLCRLHEDNLRKESKHIVFFSKLLLLFQFCHLCKADKPVVHCREVATPSRKRKRKAGHCHTYKRPIKGHKNLTGCPRNMNNGKS